MLFEDEKRKRNNEACRKYYEKNMEKRRQKSLEIYYKNRDLILEKRKNSEKTPDQKKRKKERSKLFRLKNPTYAKKYYKTALQRTHCDSYIKQYLKVLGFDNPSKEIIELKRTVILINREIRKCKQHLSQN